MKKLIFALSVLLLLTGCGAQETFETVSDQNMQPVMATLQQLTLALPEEAAAPAMESPEQGKLYICDGYTLTVQTMASGDLDQTLQQLTGFTRDQLTVMETEQGDVRRIQCVWTAVGEGGDCVGRALVLDDGNYHYAVTVMAQSEMAGQLTGQWQEILDSATLSTD